jgi:perosamine synthetase
MTAADPTRTERLTWWVPLMGEREKELLAEVIDRQFPNDGEYTTAFEQKIAEICDVPYAVAVTSGTMAITAALMACGLSHGDEVIVPDITFIATANAVQMAGGVPVLVDVRQDDLMIDPEAITRAITPRTAAIVPVHVSGRPAPMDEIIQIASEYDLYVVEDTAEGLGSRWQGKALGSFGDAGTFSFSPAKTITTGQGGAVITQDEEIHEKLRLLKDQGRPVRGTGGADNHIALGFNMKFTNLQAAMGLAQLEDFENRVAHQRKLYEWYRQYVPESPRLRLMDFDVKNGICPQWVDIWVDGCDDLVEYFEVRGIQPRKFWFPLHTQLPYRQADDAFPVATRVGDSAMWLPSALTMTEDDVQFVCQAIKNWLESAKPAKALDSAPGS